MPGEAALDTNIVIAYFKGETAVKKKVLNLERVFLPVPVVGELLFAAENSARRRENLAIYREFTSACRMLNLTHRTAAVYSKIKLELKRRGRPIPEMICGSLAVLKRIYSWLVATNIFVKCRTWFGSV